jgi:hypothetical protein
MEHLEETLDLSEDPQGKVSSGGRWLSRRKISDSCLRVNYDVVGSDEIPGGRRTVSRGEISSLQEHSSGGLGMALRSSFTEMKAEQARMTASWKAEGRVSEAWVVADPEIVEIFNAGVNFGMEVSRRGHTEPAYSPDEWRRALRAAVESAAAMEEKLESTKGEIPKKEKE